MSLLLVGVIYKFFSSPESRQLIWDGSKKKPQHVPGLLLVEVQCDSALVANGGLYALGNSKELLGRTPSDARRSLAAQLLSSDSCLSCCQSCNGHAVGAATDVVETHLVAEGDGGGFSTMFAADAKFDLWTRLST